MDAVTALGVAAAALQFVDFGIKLVSKTRQLHGSFKGALPENIEIEDASKRIHTMVDTLQSALTPRGQAGGQGPISESDQILEEICKGCVDVSKQLLTRMEKLKVKDTKHRKWKSFRQALKTVWSKEGIREIQEKLVGFERQLGTHTLLYLREKVTSQESRLGGLDSTLQQILDGISQTELLEQLRKMDISSEKLDLSSEEAHVKTRKILLDSIESQFVTFVQVQTSEHDTTRKRIREESDATRQFEESEHKKTRTVLSSEIHQYSEEKLIRQVELTILQSLRFETMHHRSDAIKEEYARTFEWIFHDPDNMAGSGSDPGTNLELVTESDAIVARPTQEHPPGQWSNFAQWLRSGNDIYWISGKAGSGKSTLMKLIVEHSKTKDILAEWAQGSEIEAPGFYFWISGSPEERSQEGLFRSLLYELLEKRPWLIRTVCQTEWADLLQYAQHDLESDPRQIKWTLSRLKRCFHRLITQAGDRMRFCFFIDGLDEYEGDHAELAEHFYDLSTLPSVKFCISSRPFPDLKAIFADAPQLRLQDLTQRDIETYTYERLSSDKRVQAIAATHSATLEALVELILHKAEGVFLWVTLAVSSLLKGLRQNDTLQLLYTRLDEISPNLDGMYSHMLSSIEPVYREQGSKLFQIMRVDEHYAELGVDYWFDLSLVYDAITANTTSVLETPLATESSVEASACECLAFRKAAKVDAIVSTSSGGLVEEIFRGQGQERLAHLNWIHRTARDYVRKPQVWQELVSWHTTRNSEGPFDPHLALAMSHVMQIKQVPPHYNQGDQCICSVPGYPGIHLVLTMIIFHTYRMLPTSEKLQATILDEFSHAATGLLKVLSDLDESCGPDQNLQRLEPRSEMWMHERRPAVWHEDFLLCAIEQGVWQYVEEKIRENPRLLIRDNAEPPLLLHAFVLHRFDFWSPEIDWRRFLGCCKTVTTLIDLGCNPNQMFNGFSVWEYWVSLLRALSVIEFYSGDGHIRKDDPRRFDAEVEEVTFTMLNSGVSLDVRPIDRNEVWEKLITSNFGVCSGTIFQLYIKYPELIGSAERISQETVPMGSPMLDIRDSMTCIGEDSFLTMTITELFQTKVSPHGAKRLLQLIRTA